jgi:hypothetical protein
MTLNQIDHRVQEIMSSPRYVKLEQQRARGLLDYDGIVELEGLKQKIEQLKRAKVSKSETVPHVSVKVGASNPAKKNDSQKHHSGLFSSLFSKPKQAERFVFVDEDHLSDRAISIKNKRYQKYMEEIEQAEEDEEYEVEDPFASGEFL